MELTYDPRYNIAYLRFQPKRAGIESIKISDEVIVDFSMFSQQDDKDRPDAVRS